MTKIKLAFLISTLDVGGAERQLVNTINGLSLSKYEIRVFVLKNKVTIANQIKKGVEIDVLEFKSFRNPFTLLRGLNQIAKFKPQILHSVMYASNLIARLYKLRSPNVRVVNHIHGLGTWIKPPHILLDRFLLFGVDKIVVVSKKSKEIREKREKYPKSKLSILYNSLDCSVYQSSPSVLRSSNAIVLGMACRLVELKQVNLCIRMLSNLNKEGLNITLKIAGDGPEKEKLVHLSESLGLANKVEFLGYVKDMQDFYRSIDCLVVCSRTEDLPLSIVESFAVGKHAISTNVGSISELFEKTDGLLVQDIEADFSIIFDYLKHGEIISESKANRKFASQYFDIKIHTTNLEKIYAELLNS